MAESLANRYHRGVSEIFYRQARKRYVFKPENLFDAIDNLKLLSHEHLIIAFGVDLFKRTDFSNVRGLKDGKYKGIKIYSFPKCNYRLVGESLFILKRDCLPSIDYLDVAQTEITKYSYEKIDDEHLIYATVIDLFRNENLRNELAQSRPDENLTKSVYLSIAMQVRLRWREDMNMLILRLYSKYDERGLINTPDEIIPFD